MARSKQPPTERTYPEDADLALLDRLLEQLQPAALAGDPGATTRLLRTLALRRELRADRQKAASVWRI